jgi:ParB-like chromosome segregation protein Spo0J
MSKKSNVLSFDDMLAGKLDRAGNRERGFSPVNAPDAEDLEAADEGGEFIWVDVDLIDDNPYQPRLEIKADSDDQRDLVMQINDDGQEYPARARPHPTKPGRFQLISGHRRKYAVKHGALFHDRPGAAPRPVFANAGVKQPKPDTFSGKLLLRVDRRPASETDTGMRRRVYQENRSRKDLAVIENARFFKATQDEMTKVARENGQLADDKTVSVRAIAQELGERDHTRIQRALAVLTLPPKIVEALEIGTINERHGRGLLVLQGHPKAQMALFREVLKDELSGAATERLAAERFKLLQEKTPTLAGTATAQDPMDQTPAEPLPDRREPVKPGLSLVGAGAEVTVTSSTVAQLPNLPQLVSDQLQSAASALSDAGAGLALLDIAPQDLAVYESKIAELEKLIKRARREINQRKTPNNPQSKGAT